MPPFYFVAHLSETRSEQLSGPFASCPTHLVSRLLWISKKGVLRGKQRVKISSTSRWCNFEPVDDEEGDEALEVGFFEEIESDEPALPPLEAMKQLKEMADSGLITEEDFQEEKKEILSRM